MTFVVPFDGTALAEAALVRAVEFSQVLDEPVVAVTVVPKGDRDYAREKGWIGDDESLEASEVVSTLHERVVDLAPQADYRHCLVGRYAPAGTIAGRIRDVAEEEGATMLFVGSENAGRIVTAVSSVGAKVAANDAYDVVIVRNRAPTDVAELRRRSPYQDPKSDFHLRG